MYELFIIHCLRLGHETIVCAVCLSIYFCCKTNLAAVMRLRHRALVLVKCARLCFYHPINNASANFGFDFRENFHIINALHSSLGLNTSVNDLPATSYTHGYLRSGGTSCSHKYTSTINILTTVWRVISLGSIPFNLITPTANRYG